MILLIDNYDSFVYNLARYFERLGHATRVVRNTAIDAAGVRRLRPGGGRALAGAVHARAGGLLAGAGPHAGTRSCRCWASAWDIRRSPRRLAGGWSGPRSRSTAGRRRSITTAAACSPGCRTRCVAGRYHSLVVDEASLPDCLEVTARTDDGTIMAIEHRELPVVGLQFHPESILTDCGYPLLGEFPASGGTADAGRVAATEMRKRTGHRR